MTIVTIVPDFAGFRMGYRLRHNRAVPTTVVTIGKCCPKPRSTGLGREGSLATPMTMARRRFARLLTRRAARLNSIVTDECELYPIAVKR